MLTGTSCACFAMFSTLFGCESELSERAMTYMGLSQLEGPGVSPRTGMELLATTGHCLVVHNKEGQCTFSRRPVTEHNNPLEASLISIPVS